MSLKRMLEKLGVPKTHLELKKLIKEVSGGSGETFSYSDFLKMMLGKRSAILKMWVFTSNLLYTYLFSSPPLPPALGSPSTHYSASISSILWGTLTRSYPYPWSGPHRPQLSHPCPSSSSSHPCKPYPLLNFHSSLRFILLRGLFSDPCVSSHLNQDPDVWGESKGAGEANRSSHQESYLWVALICGRGKFGEIEGASNNLNTKKEDKIVSQSQTKINSPSPPDQVILVSVWEIFFPLGLERSEASLRQEQQGFAQTSNLSPVV